MLFFFNDTATTEIYTLSLHDALPIFLRAENCSTAHSTLGGLWAARFGLIGPGLAVADGPGPEYLTEETVRAHRSEEHTSELQSRQYLVCRLLLEKKKKTN